MSTPDFFRSRLDAMIDMRHPLVVLSARLPWARIEAALAPKFERQDRASQQVVAKGLFGEHAEEFGGGVSNAGRPRLSIRLMASLVYLKNSFNLSDEELVERWSENVVWQFFSGQAYYEPRLPCDATQIGRFRRAIGEEGLEQLLKSTIETAVEIKAVKPAELERVIVDTTVQEKAIAHPVDSRLLEIARRKVVGAAKRAGIALKQTVAKEGKELRRKASGYAHAKQSVLSLSSTNVSGDVVLSMPQSCAGPARMPALQSLLAFCTYFADCCRPIAATSDSSLSRHLFVLEPVEH